MHEARAPSLIGTTDGGIVVGWHGPLGPCAAWFEAWSRERPLIARTFGAPGADVAAVPALWAQRDALAVLWCEDDGAHVARLHRTGSVSVDRLLVPGAYAVAVAGGSNAAVFAADDAGIVRVELDEHLRTIGEPRRCVAERRAGLMLSAAQLSGEAILVFAHRGAPSFGVVHGETTVRHTLRGDCEDLDVAAAGGRAAVVLEIDGAIEHAEIAADAKLIERPRPLFPRESGAFSSPRAVWTEDSFAALARHGDRLRVEPLGPKGDAFVLPRCDGPFDALFWRQHFLAVEVHDEEIRLWRCKRDGSAPQQRTIPIALDDAEQRRAKLVVRNVLASLSDRIEQAHGYRERGSRAALAHDGSRLDVVDERGRVTLGVRVTETSALRLTVTSAIGEDASPEEPSSLVRLARRLFSKKGSASDTERSWAAHVASRIDAGVVHVERAGAVMVLELELAVLPTADRLESWLRELRSGQTP